MLFLKVLPNFKVLSKNYQGSLKKSVLWHTLHQSPPTEIFLLCQAGDSSIVPQVRVLSAAAQFPFTPAKPSPGYFPLPQLGGSV